MAVLKARRTLSDVKAAAERAMIFRDCCNREPCRKLLLEQHGIELIPRDGKSVK